MIELIQFPWSPFCIVQRRLLEASGRPFKITNIPVNDRALVWRLTRQRYYGVPIVRDGSTVVFELADDTQTVAKYLDSKLELGLFPWRWEGVQNVVWRWIENEIEGPCFKLNDTWYYEFVPKGDQLGFVRHKERKFGRGCIDRWASSRQELLAELEEKLVPFEEMLIAHDFLLEDRPRFVDFDLYGMLANFLFSGHYRLPVRHGRLKKWFARMSKVQLKYTDREEKLHPRH